MWFGLEIKLLEGERTWGASRTRTRDHETARMKKIIKSIVARCVLIRADEPVPKICNKFA